MITKILFIALGILAALYVMISILTSGSNALSESMIYLGIFGVIIAFLNPKLGMAFLFLLGNYLDLIKRFLVVGGTFSWTDIIRTLAIPPIITGMIFISLSIRHFRTTNQTWPWFRFMIAGVICGLVSLSSLMSGDTLQNIAQSIANSALYAGYICYAAFLYKDNHAHKHLFRYLIIIFAPVAIYSWVQLTYGYNLVEMEYARSGFTVSTQPLLHPSEVEYKRIFSTMNSSGAYTLVGSTLSIFAILFGFRQGFLGRIAGFIFAAVCLSSQIPGAGRTGWAITIVTFVAYFVFKSGRFTIATYFATVVFSALFLLNADAVGEWLVVNTQGVAGDSDFSQRASNMGTFTTRTMGITEWMTNESYFSWFGLPKAEIIQAGAHDLVGQIYVSSGIVGLTLAATIGASILFYLHRNLLLISDTNNKQLASFYMANIFAILFSGIFSGSSLHIFPLNLYFWLMVGLLFQIIDSNKKKANTPLHSFPAGEYEAVAAR
ncbi:MAG: hypothetical protein EOP84_00080 [Verrucomicrobiaceae bacterium]|nr:MAG: hypothetical protein EOP84_00080 [Verrucomicrobiaceae bacterium]